MAAKVTATKPAKRPARRPVPAAPALPGAEPEFEAPRLTTETGPEERVVLFYIDDSAYSIVRRPGVNIGLQYLHLSRTEGESVALDYLLEALLGPEGYEALRNYDQLTTEQFQQITKIASDLTLGSLEAPKA